MQRILMSLFVSMLLWTFGTIALAVESVDYSEYKFAQRDALQEKLEAQSANLNKRVESLKGSAPQDVLREMREAEDDLDDVANKLNGAKADDWEKVRNSAENTVNKMQKNLYEVGAFAENFDVDKNDTWWDVK